MFLEESATDELQALAVKAVYSLCNFIAKECQPMNEAAKMLEARVIAAEDRLRAIDEQLVGLEVDQLRLARVEAVSKSLLDPGEQPRPVSVWKHFLKPFAKAFFANGSAK